jgi:hypothetical protein
MTKALRRVERGEPARSLSLGSMGLVVSVCQPSTLRMLIWPKTGNAQSSMAAVSADGSTICVLIRRFFLKSASPLTWREPRERKGPNLESLCARPESKTPAG